MLQAFKLEHGIWKYQSELIRALVESVTIEKQEFVGEGFKIVIRNPKKKP